MVRIVRNTGEQGFHDGAWLGRGVESENGVIWQDKWVHEYVITWELLAVQAPLNSPLMVHGGARYGYRVKHKLRRRKSSTQLQN